MASYGSVSRVIEPFPFLLCKQLAKLRESQRNSLQISQLTVKLSPTDGKPLTS
jgi:hypothetical protein